MPWREWAGIGLAGSVVVAAVLLALYWRGDEEPSPEPASQPVAA